MKRDRASLFAGLLILMAGLLVAPGVRAASFSVGSASGGAGETVEICVYMASEGDEVVGVQADMVWNGDRAEINASSCQAGGHGKPLHKSQRSGSRLRAILLALDNVDPIDDSFPLWCCNFTILDGDDDEPIKVTLDNVSVSDSIGNPSQTTSYGGAILRPGSLQVPSRDMALGAGAAADTLEERVVSGGGASDAPVVAVGDAAADAPGSGSAGASSAAGEGGAEAGAAAGSAGSDVPRSVPPVEDIGRQPVAKAGAGREADAGAPRAVAGDQSTPSVVPTLEAKSAASTPEAQAEPTEEGAVTPEATGTAAKATATAIKIEARRTRAKAVAPKEKDESACQIVTGTSGTGALLLLLGAVVLGVLARRHCRR